MRRRQPCNRWRCVKHIMGVPQGAAQAAAVHQVELTSDKRLHLWQILDKQLVAVGLGAVCVHAGKDVRSVVHILNALHGDLYGSCWHAWVCWLSFGKAH